MVMKKERAKFRRSKRNRRTNAELTYGMKKSPSILDVGFFYGFSTRKNVTFVMKK